MHIHFFTDAHVISSLHDKWTTTHTRKCACATKRRQVNNNAHKKMCICNQTQTNEQQCTQENVHVQPNTDKWTTTHTSKCADRRISECTGAQKKNLIKRAHVNKHRRWLKHATKRMIKLKCTRKLKCAEIRKDAVRGGSGSGSKSRSLKWISFAYDNHYGNKYRTF